MSDPVDRSLERLAAPVGSSDPPAALRDRISRDLAPVRAGRRRARLRLPLAAMAAVVLPLASAMPRPDLAQQPPERMGIAVLACVTAVATGLAMLFAPGRHGLGPSARARVWWLLACVVAFEAVTAWSTVAVRGSVTPTGADALHAGLGCTVEGATPALLVALAVVRAARCTAVASPWSAALVAGAASGFVGTLVQQLVCPVAMHGHTMTAHLAPVLLGAISAAVFARRALSV